MLVIDYKTIITDRGAPLVNLSKLLSQLFKDPANLDKSIIFVITKAPGLKMSQLQDKIEGILNQRKSSSEIFKQSLTRLFQQGNQKPDLERDIDENQQVITVLKLFTLNDYKNVSIINIFDDTSKKEIEKLVSQCNPLPVSAFNFSYYNPESVKFDEALVHIVNNNLNLINNRNKIIDNVNRKEEKVVEFDNNITMFNEHLKLLDKTKASKPKEIEENQRNLTKQILDKQEKIDKLQDSRIFILNMMPDSEKLANYVNSYLIFLVDDKAIVYYINRHCEKQLISRYPSQLEAIIREISGNKPLNLTVGPELKKQIIRKEFSINDFFNIYRFFKLFPFDTIYLLSKLPEEEYLGNFKQSVLIIKERNQDIDIGQNITFKCSVFQ